MIKRFKEHSNQKNKPVRKHFDVRIEAKLWFKLYTVKKLMTKIPIIKLLLEKAEELLYYSQMWKYLSLH